MQPDDRLAYYTQAELDVMALVGAGLTYSEIAELLGITKNSVWRRIRRARDRHESGRKPLVRVHDTRLTTDN